MPGDIWDTYKINTVIKYYISSSSEFVSREKINKTYR